VILNNFGRSYQEIDGNKCKRKRGRGKNEDGTN